jgi:FkbM family methyltransferase
MSTKNSKALDFIKKYPFFKKVFFFYNVYIRNYQFYFNGSQFSEEKKILKLFKENYKGRYVDLGCFHPTRSNNTFKMYKKGWRGINIDLNPLTIELFNYARKKDINICSAISNKKTQKKLYFLGDLDSKNTLNLNHKQWLSKHFRINKKDFTIKNVKTRKLGDILEKYNFYKIDFMNIDIEGHELEVLKSLDFKKFNIQVICIEILNYNNSTLERKKKLISFLKKNKYSLAGRSTVNYIFKRKNR